MKTIDISGFGGSYEAACQKMLINGLKWLNEHPDFDFKVYESNPNIVGIMTGKGNDAKELDNVVCEGIEPSGAMHHVVISHLAYIHENSYDGWINEAGKQGATVYELPSEDELDKTILVSQVEWQLKLDSGYNPLAELFKNIPMDDVITVNSDDPESIKKAADEIARRIKL